MDKNSNNYEQRKSRKEFYMKNGFKAANYSVKEKGVGYDMLYYNEDDKTVKIQEFKELMKNYFGKILYKQFYKNL